MLERTRAPRVSNTIEPSNPKRKAGQAEAFPEEDAGELARERDSVERAQAGDPSALEPLFARHAEPLFALLVARAGDRALAEELLKDALAAAVDKIATFRWQGRSLYWWLRQIALNKLVDHHRRRGRAQRLVDALRAEAEAEPPAARADDALIAEEERRRAMARIESAMAELPPRYARAIRLRLIDDLGRQECADALGVQVGNFDVILFRAVRAFRKAYG